jgi:S1-C subfamily serine protease
MEDVFKSSGTEYYKLLYENRKNGVSVESYILTGANKTLTWINSNFASLGGSAVGDTDDIQTALESHAVGQAVAAAVLRGGESRNISITVGERPRRS